MHAKTDSDATSIPGSSPTRSPPHRPANGHGQVYYVQSPSRDSHDGEKTTNSFHSSPAVLSPMGSPDPHSHSNSSLGRHSRDSSSTRFSRSMKPGGSGKANRSGGGKGGAGAGMNNKEWKGGHHHQFDAIEEEENLLGQDDHENVRTISRRWYCVGFVAAFFLLFSFFSLVLWGASRNQKPIITMKSVNFEEFDIQAGTDHSGVATAMASLNATVKLVYRNRGTFFGVHVTSTPLQLYYQSLTIASGAINNFYEKRKSERRITVRLLGDSIPLYGGGSNLSSKKGAPTSPVPLTLHFKVRSRAYVLGKLVKPKFYKTITCSLVMDPQKMNAPISLNLCTYW
ncbi:hypothetical protein Ancab_003799 [Ancistrocladus abbreviatus]